MFQAFIITLREGVEAAVVAGIALACRTDGGRKRHAQIRRRAGHADGAVPDGGRGRTGSGMPEQSVALTDLEVGEAGTIEQISLPPAEEQFLMRIGFVPGADVRFSRRAPLGDPSVYAVDGTEIALRAETARHIVVRRGWLSPLGDLP
jgi:Fe2+ transport system protein FeoA